MASAKKSSDKPVEEAVVEAPVEETVTETVEETAPEENAPEETAPEETEAVVEETVEEESDVTLLAPVDDDNNPASHPIISGSRLSSSVVDTIRAEQANGGESATLAAIEEANQS